MPRALKAKLVLGPAATDADAPITRIRAAAARAAVAPTRTRVRSRVIGCMDCLLDLGSVHRRYAAESRCGSRFVPRILRAQQRSRSKRSRTESSVAGVPT